MVYRSQALVLKESHMAREPEKTAPPWARFNTKPGIITLSVDRGKKRKSPFFNPDTCDVGGSNNKTLRKG